MAVLLVFSAAPVAAHDDGRFADSQLKPWFDQLASKKGLCCSFADGIKVENVDWDSEAGHYRVRLCPGSPDHASVGPYIDCPAKDWIVVPEGAVITEPNRFGPAVVWPYLEHGKTAIRCFLPGAGA